MTRPYTQQAREYNRRYYAEHKRERQQQAKEKWPAYYAANAAKLREKSVTYHAEHREERRANARQYHAEHREERIEKSRGYRAAHREELNAKNREAYAKKREDIRARARQRHASDPEKRRRVARRYHANNPERNRLDVARRRSLKAGAPVVDLSLEQWQEIKAHYGHRCVYCGRKMKRLEQEHITALSKGGSDTVANVVPACRSCNAKKRDKAPLRPVQPLLLTVAEGKKARKKPITAVAVCTSRQMEV